MSEKKMQNTPARIRRVEENVENPNKIISQKLKALYSAVEQEEIPDRFLNLLEKLDEAERRQADAGSDDNA